MANDATLVYGCRFFYSTNNSDWNELEGMKSIGPTGSPERPDVDITPLYDTEDARQFSQGLAVYGEVECSQFWNKTRHTLLQTHFKARTLLYWRIRYPDNPSVPANASRTEFRGRLKKLSDSAKEDPDGVLMLPFTIKITGETTFTPGV